MLRNSLSLRTLNKRGIQKVIVASGFCPNFGPTYIPSGQVTRLYSSKPYKLPFNDIRHSETFGQVVVSDKLRRDGELNVTAEDNEMSPFRNSDGTFVQGSTADEARLDPLTLVGRVDRSVARLPPDVALAIGNNILSVHSPDKLRERSAVIFQQVSKEQLQQAPELPLDCDAHIASLFLQNYSHAIQVLLELRDRVENFNPQRVLDIGYGPATGMVALNELMGPDWDPEVKDVYVVGRKNHEMKKRAKIILLRQLSEVPEASEAYEAANAADQGAEEEVKTDEVEQSQSETSESEKSEKSEIELESESNPASDSVSSSDYVGPVDTSRIKIKSRLRNSLPTTKQYDLIIVNQSLLTREYNFPKDVDTNIHTILPLLKPDGHLVLIERGNALGSETIARARQIMIRPESYPEEPGKIPRPYIKGSTGKPQKKYDQIVSEADIEHEEFLLKQLEALDAQEEFEQKIIDAHGEVDPEELKFEFEDSDDFEVIEEKTTKNEEVSTDNSTTPSTIDYHLSILAPHPHHKPCPLQLGDPKYYRIPNHKHKMDFLSFTKTVHRPKYTMELKKGRRLATQWDKGSEDGFGIDNLTKGVRRALSGGGRPGSNNTETGSYSYLIAHRSPNDAETIARIEYERAHSSSIEISPEDPNYWPRIISNPTKIKNNVKFLVLAPSGNVELWQVPKSLGKQIYHDARKVQKGDLWPHGKKGVMVKNRLSAKVREKLDVLSKMNKKSFLKEQSKKQWKKVVTRTDETFHDDIVTMADSYASALEQTKKYKQQGKRAKFDVDPKSYDGK